ncbi:MAG: CBS domain-containing protein [Candidatus Bathyarchaeota archaeon]|nr:CBS domain-containing protein [Candidatus Bathyarchaeota archaeon]MDW8040073.1 CBS domain-containing protein [Nitrososphaerota archaeon]
MSRETFRRTLRGKGPVSLKSSTTKKREGEILHIAKSPVITMAPTTPIYDAVKIMAKEGFRRIPIADPGTKALAGIVTATDIVDYLGGGKRFEIVQQKFSGNIFKAINEPVKLIMTQKVFAVKTTAEISEAVQIMKEKNLGGLPVIDEENRVRAIITERDIAYMFAGRISGVKVAELMTSQVVTALPQTTIFEAEKSMIAHGFRRLPIVADGKVVGIITAMDIIRFFGTGEVFKHLQSGTITQVLNTPVFQIATKNISTVEPNADVGQAAELMREKNLGALPVVQNGKLVGIITERDFFKIIE